MLGSSVHRIESSQSLSAQARVELSAEEAHAFFSLKGPMGRRDDNRRAFHRFFMRSEAVLLGDGFVYAVYTCDISRQGIGFLSPRQLLPHQKCKLELPNGSRFDVLIKRCRRENDNCFVCGARFTSAKA
ncbi:PilZ domain-containing protein [Lacipirellula parvula]|uniref:PilZ domain-containing protein n=1 Tax=Lacipirellula parvula TaxID=2650471 RepID=A0A5K7XFN3_9BACT|nr:hypothetical protein PLANPX_4817 [Lacipirellula parvula]